MTSIDMQAFNRGIQLLLSLIEGHSLVEVLLYLVLIISTIYLIGRVFFWVLKRINKDTVLRNPQGAVINPNGTFTATIFSKQGYPIEICILKSADGYLGPNGELYKEFPNVALLESVYCGF